MFRAFWFVAICAAVALRLALHSPLAAAHDRDDDHDDGDKRSHVKVHTQFGPIVGVDDSDNSGTHFWKGVPFAKPPVGALRWRAPADPDAWQEPKKTQQFGNACVQYGRIYGPGLNNRFDETIAQTLNQAVGSEDCLYLNIWRPANGHGGLPVIVFVHGGSNVSGYTADPVYDGAALAKEANAVVVSVNYRLGIFGFLNLTQLKVGDPVEDSGNFAMLDILKALQFINHEIPRFGGNPSKVTLMGQSAGAVNVYAMLTSPLVVNARPRLFDRAVPLSGGISLASDLPPVTPGQPPILATLAPASVYLLQGNQLLAQQLIVDGLATDLASAQAYIASHTAAELAGYLRSKTPAQLLFTLLAKLAALGLAGSGPIPDGTVLPISPINAIKAGQYLKVPVLAGNTRDEAKLFPTFLAIHPGFGGVSGRLVNDYTLFSVQCGSPTPLPQTTPPAPIVCNPNVTPTAPIDKWIPGVYLPVDTPVTGFNARTDVFNQHFFLPSRDNVLDALKSQQDEVWYYRFDWDREPAPWNDIYGAAHVFDLPFIFRNFGPSLFGTIISTQQNRRGRLDLSEAMMQSIAAFARHGNPNDRELGVYWPTWPRTLIFDATDTRKVISVE